MEMLDLSSWAACLTASGKWILVEGKKDQAALLALGVDHVKEMERKPLYKIVDECSALGTEWILLVDLDSEGKKLYSVLRSEFEKLGIKIDHVFREWLFRETNIRQIESLNELSSTCHSPGRGKPCSRLVRSGKIGLR
ncbi:hypothetical protein HZB02_01260 [Candidatus Woesearchaeota archaeon]|nr:hypothetical protein [Candidatus Woesearchaeota archaeon]